ncbi:MAG TPA: MarC family protein [Dehalococcoidia bacterium]|nr:MarC family protein [Dehalococcoidia bacterium]
MVEIIRELALTFVPLFFAMDAVGNLPIFLALTQEIRATRRRQTVNLATLTALGVGLGFVAIGKAIFLLLGIEVADFLMAGGIILLILAIRYLITGKMVETQDLSASETVGVVPLGTPLVVGPAVLATLLLLMGQYRIPIVLSSFILNLVIQWLVFRQADRIVDFLGRTGANAVSKIVMLLLAAIAVKMIREGVLTILG